MSDSSNWALDGDKDFYNTIPDYELPPEGFYYFELVGKEEDKPQDAKYDPTGTKLRTQFHFKIVDDEDWNDTKISPFYNLTLNEKGYFLPLAEALLGRKLGPKERVGWEDDPNNNVSGLMNLRIGGMLKHDTKEDGRVFGKIEAPVPYKRPRRNKAVAAPAEETAALAASTETDEVPF